MQKETAFWVDALNGRDVPAGAILTLETAVKQEQIQQRKAFGKVHVEGIGELELFNMTAKFSKTPGVVEAPPPTLGQHTNDILTRIGYSQAEIQQLKDCKAI
jgi:crotonobetainyl-CoA:carnitine CoA-transferase CaiB-like acyl-CoA transferase